MDPLTNCLSRSEANQEWLDATLVRNETGSFLLTFDVDSLVNHLNYFGIHSGDQRLIELAEGLRRSLPEIDVVRTGGDEFMAVVSQEFLNKTFLEDLLVSLEWKYEEQEFSYPKLTLIEKLQRMIGVELDSKRLACKSTKIFRLSISCCVTKLTTTSLEKLMKSHSDALQLLYDLRRTIKGEVGNNLVVAQG